MNWQHRAQPEVNPYCLALRPRIRLLWVSAYPVGCGVAGAPSGHRTRKCPGMARNRGKLPRTQSVLVVTEGDAGYIQE